MVESPCIAVVGASGGIYGLMGMFLMEMVINWKALKRYKQNKFRFLVPHRAPPPLSASLTNQLNIVLPCRKLTRIGMIISFTIIFTISIALDNKGTSHLSHVGGVFFGVFWALAVMPKGLSQAWRVISIIVGIIGLISSITCLYLYFYLSIFPAICCGGNCS